MSRKLYQEDIIKILDLINTWDGALTWGLIINDVCKLLKRGLTRQCLARHPEIVNAYALAKLRCKKQTALAHNPVQLRSGNADNLKELQLKEDNSRLRKENERLLIMIRNLQLVAYSKCIREEELNEI